MLEQHNKLPMMLHHLTRSNFSEMYSSEEEFFSGSEYSFERKMNVMANGEPLYCARSSTPPTSTHTAGHTIPAGYTPSGKWKNSKWVAGKTDRRAGH